MEIQLSFYSAFLRPGGRSEQWFLIVLSAFKNNNIDSVPRQKYSYLHGQARYASRNVLEIHGTKFHTKFYVAYKLSQ